MAFTPLVPSTWAGIGANSDMNIVMTEYDLPPIEQLALRTTYKERSYFTEILKYYGMATGTSKPKVGHASVDRPVDAPKFDSIVSPAGAAGAPMTVRINAAWMYSGTPGTIANVSGVAAKSSPLRPNDIILLPNREHARVMSKSSTGAQHTFVLRPLKATTNLDTVILSANHATDVFPIITNSYADGSNIGETKSRRIRRYSNEFQIVKEQCTLTGGAKTIELYHTSETGARGNVKTVHLDRIMRESYDRDRSYTLLHGQKTTNTGIVFANPILGYDSAVKTTEGFIPFAETEGHDMTVTFSTYSLDDFRDLALLLEQNFTGSTDYWYFASMTALSAVSKQLLQTFGNTADRYLMKKYDEMPVRNGDVFNFTSSEDYAVKVGFKSVCVDGYDWRLQSLHELNDSKGLGAITHYQNWAIAAPIGFETDTESQEAMPMFGYQYLKLGKYSRESLAGTWGGFMSKESSDIVNEWDIEHQAIGCHIAAHMYNGNHMVIQHQ